MHGKSASREVRFCTHRVQPDAQEMKGLDGIVGMNVLRELKNLVLSGKELIEESKFSRGTDANVRRVIARVNKDEGLLGPEGRIGFVKVSGKHWWSALIMLLFQKDC